MGLALTTVEEPAEVVEEEKATSEDSKEVREAPGCEAVEGKRWEKEEQTESAETTPPETPTESKAEESGVVTRNKFKLPPALANRELSTFEEYVELVLKPGLLYSPITPSRIFPTPTPTTATSLPSTPQRSSTSTCTSTSTSASPEKATPQKCSKSEPVTPEKKKPDEVARKLILRGACADLIDMLHDVSTKGPEEVGGKNLLKIRSRFINFRRDHFVDRLAVFRVVCLWEERDEQGEWHVASVHGTTTTVLGSTRKLISDHKVFPEDRTRVRTLPMERWEVWDDPIASARAARKALIVKK